jgi:hypothetical protein
MDKGMVGRFCEGSPGKSQSDFSLLFTRNEASLKYIIEGL